MNTQVLLAWLFLMSVDIRGSDAVLKDMRKHPEDARVQEKGCAALMNLALINTDNSVKIGARGGVDAIVQAMDGHSGSEGVQRLGCAALWSLANNADNMVKIGARQALIWRRCL